MIHVRQNRPLTFALVATHGTLGTLNQSNAIPTSITYTPSTNYCGQDSFTFKVNDGGLDSDPATVDITVGKRPAATSVTVSTCQNTATNLTLSGNDPCQEIPTFAIISGPTNGILSGTPPALTYTPSNGFCGQDGLVFKVIGDCEDSDAASVTITVGDPNPVANCQDVMTGTNTPVTLTLSGSDTCGETLRFTLETEPEHGTLSATTQTNATSAWVTYTPSNNFEGIDGFDFTVSNCSFTSQLAHVTIYVVRPPLLTAVCGPDRVVLRWTIPPWVEPYVTDFLIKRSTTVGGPYTVVQTNEANKLLYEDTNVTTGVTYCYVVSVRRLDPCSGAVRESSDSNEICLSTCSEPPCGQEIISGWLFTDRGFVAGGQNGKFCSYSNPADALASPWSFLSPDQRSLRLPFENDYNCRTHHGLPYNPYIQIATAEAVIAVGCPTRIRFNWCGIGERHQSFSYELMTSRVNDEVLADAHSPGDLGTYCEAGMGPTVPRAGTPEPPQEILLPSGLHILRIRTDTGDPLFHFGAYYEFEFTFLESE